MTRSESVQKYFTQLKALKREEAQALKQLNERKKDLYNQLSFNLLDWLELDEQFEYSFAQTPEGLESCEHLTLEVSYEGATVTIYSLATLKESDEGWAVEGLSIFAVNDINKKRCSSAEELRQTFDRCMAEALIALEIDIPF